MEPVTSVSQRITAVVYPAMEAVFKQGPTDKTAYVAGREEIDIRV